eukprot:8538554-Heterocapsa_arctica.AAC.1
MPRHVGHPSQHRDTGLICRGSRSGRLTSCTEHSVPVPDAFASRRHTSIFSSATFTKSLRHTPSCRAG